MNVGVVVIGRNEGERLLRCLRSIVGANHPIVYVDSSSTDGSLEAARALGATAISLPTDQPFTAGRARNHGFSALRDAHPRLDHAMFVDGDCEVADGWIAGAIAYLEANPAAAVVCGRRAERFPDASIYNAMCDIEWDTPIGVAESCGGDFVVRSGVFDAIGGFNPSLIAGEEPEMCYRIRQAGWEIHRMDAPMTVHDAAIYRYSQWARRSIRSGYAYAARAWLHRRDGNRFGWRDNARIALWAAGIPLLMLALAPLAGWWALAPLALYPLQYMRLLRAKRRATAHAARYVLFLLLGNWTEFIGQCRFAFATATSRKQRIIEYK